MVKHFTSDVCSLQQCACNRNGSVYNKRCSPHLISYLPPFLLHGLPIQVHIYNLVMSKIRAYA